ATDPGEGRASLTPEGSNAQEVGTAARDDLSGDHHLAASLGNQLRWKGGSIPARSQNEHPTGTALHEDRRHAILHAANGACGMRWTSNANHRKTVAVNDLAANSLRRWRCRGRDANGQQRADRSPQPIHVPSG